MRSLVTTALICAATLGSLTVAEAMPAAFKATPSVATVAGAQVEKAVIVVTKRVIVHRPRRVVKRVIIR